MPMMQQSDNQLINRLCPQVDCPLLIQAVCGIGPKTINQRVYAYKKGDDQNRSSPQWN
jgi:hypothetical protein